MITTMTKIMVPVTITTLLIIAWADAFLGYESNETSFLNNKQQETFLQHVSEPVYAKITRHSSLATSKAGTQSEKRHRLNRRFLKKLKKKLKKFKKDWKLSKKEARKLFEKYYVCIGQKLEELKKEGFVIQGVLALEGETVRLKCTVWAIIGVTERLVITGQQETLRYPRVTNKEGLKLEGYRPDQPKHGQEAQWQFLRHEDTGLVTLTTGHDVKIKKDNTLVIKDIDVTDAGQYYCLEKHDYAAIYQVDVFLRDLRRYVVFGSNQLQNETILAHRNLRVFTMWTVWGKCNVCGQPGRRTRVGQCTVKKIYADFPVFPRDYPLISLYPEGIPCHSTALPRHIRQLPEVGRRHSETLVATCKEPCATEPPQIMVTDDGGDVIDVLEPGYYPMNAKPKLPSLVKRKVLYEIEGVHLVIRCPTKDPKMVRWMRGEREVDPATIQRQTKGRVKVDSLNRLHLSPLLMSDTAVYDCWKRKRRVAAIKVLVVEAENQQIKLYISYAGMGLTVVGSLAFLCCMCCKKSDKNAK